MSDNFEDLTSEPEVVSEEEVQEQPEAEEPPKEEPKIEEKPEQMVPLSAMIEERSKRQALEMMLQRPQEKREPDPIPDVFEDQAAYTQHLVRMIQGQSEERFLNMSQFAAAEKYGEDLVRETEQYVREHPEVVGQFRNHPSPWHAAVNFYQSQKLAEEIGNDPSAYREKLEAEIMAKLQAEKAAKSIPDVPSMANETSIGGRQKPSAPNFTPLSDILPE